MTTASPDNPISPSDPPPRRGSVSASGSPPNDDRVRFVSLRWRLLLPVFLIVLIITTVGAYLISVALTGDGELMRTSLLESNSQAVIDRAAAFIAEQRDIGAGFARYPEGRDALLVRNPTRINETVTTYARLAGLDALALASQSDGLRLGETIPSDYFIVEAPLTVDGSSFWTAIAGIAPSRLLDAARGSAAVELSVTQIDEAWAARGSTGSVASQLDSLSTSAVATSGERFSVTLEEVEYSGIRHALGDGLEVVVYMPADPPLAGEAGRQLIAVTLAIVAAGVVVSAVLIVTLLLERVNKVRDVAEKLAAGEVTEPTGMRPTDEIGALGYALDRYAARVQAKQDELRGSLRRQRRELEHFTAVIESIPDGVIVQDIDGFVTFMNERARQLIGERYNYFKRATTQDITAAVAETLGGMTAPGIISKGNPQRVEVDDRVISVQSAALLSIAEKQIGTVMILRDATTDARREEARAALIEQVTSELGMEYADAQTGAVESARSDGAAAFAQEARRREVALGKLLVGLRELTSVNAQVIRRAQRDIPLQMLVHAAANEWRAVASAANLSFDVVIEQPGLMVVGDERRLRWAIGNILDNAIKYTPPGGKVSLEVKGAEGGYARLRVRDNGAGISPEDLPRVFDRFYRGDPVMANGRAIQVPGAGLGLPIAREIIEAHGGLITLRSTPGIGTAVYFTLPMEGTPLPTVSPTPTDEALDEDENETVRLRP